jgi:pimeloyl-ACP methyl ester carboxylesterase
MRTKFASSPDATRIAYEISGKGPAMMLLHGGGSSRQEWHDTETIERLENEFTVIAVDMRGHGESDKTTDPAGYTTKKLGQDFLCVADDCGFDQFSLCGYSLGGNAGRYLAASSERVTRLIMIGNPLGPGVSGEWLQLAVDFNTRWAPVIDAHGDGFDLKYLSRKDQEDIKKLSFSGELVPVMLALSNAMLEWRIVGPTDLRCPTLWLFGSENKIAMDSFMEYMGPLKESKVITVILEGLSHEQEIEEIDQVLPVVSIFTR